MVLRVAAAVASIALLAGCTQAPAAPPGLDPAEFKALIAQQDAAWWTSMFPGEPQPVVAPIEYAESSAAPGRVNDCVIDAALPGVTVTYEGAYNAADDVANAALQRQLFICTLEYPAAIPDPAEAGYLSGPQLRYLYSYYRERLVPCLRTLGYSFGAFPTLDDQFADATIGGGSMQYWLPYYAMRPQPATRAEWSFIDLHCAPPPYLADWRPPVTLP